MPTVEQHAAEAERHIKEAEERICQQEQRLTILRHDRHEMTEAEKLPKNFYEILEAMRAERDLVRDELREKSAKGS